MAFAYRLEPGTKMSPNFFEMDALDVLRSPIPPNTISENKDSHWNDFDDKRKISNIDHDLCDNAVDPDIYFAQPSDRAVEQHFIVDSPPDPFLPNVQLPDNANCVAPSFARQQSYNLVMDVLNSSSVAPPNVHICEYPPTPSPERDDEILVRSPSIQQEVPFFSRERSLTESDCDHFLPSHFANENSRSRVYSADLVLSQRPSVRAMQYDACPLQLQPGTANNIGLPEVYGNDGLKVQSPIVKNILTPTPFPPVEQGVIELSQNPAVSDDSLDVSAMLNEFLETSAPVAANQESQIRNQVEDTSIAEADHVVDLTESVPSPPKLVRTTSYKRKRDRNNQACRESRKKRKVKQTEAEEKVKDLTKENEDLREQIKRLEKEVKFSNELLVSKITANMKK